MVGTREIKYPGWTKTSTAAQQFGMDLSRARRRKNLESIDEIILKLDMNIWGYKLTIIGTYAPNEDNGATVKDEFFANLNEVIIKSGSARQPILMGDMNGRTGRKTGDTAVGNFGED